MEKKNSLAKPWRCEGKVIDPQEEPQMVGNEVGKGGPEYEESFMLL